MAAAAINARLSAPLSPIGHVAIKRSISSACLLPDRDDWAGSQEIEMLMLDGLVASYLH